jgi:hypothetical protein
MYQETTTYEQQNSEIIDDDNKTLDKIRDVLYMADIDSIKPEEYQKWIYSPNCRAKRVQIFQNEYWDLMMTQMSSRNHFFVWSIAWVLIILTLIPTKNALNWLFVVFIGYDFLWKKVELILHKHIFHMKVKYNFQKYIHFLFHGLHHAAPKDLSHLMLPLTAGIPLAFIVRYILILLTAYNYDLANALMAGILIGYMRYDITHYCIHAFSTTEFGNIATKFTFGFLPEERLNSMTAKFSTLKKNHKIHHYKDHDKHFEVSYLIE